MNELLQNLATGASGSDGTVTVSQPLVAFVEEVGYKLKGKPTISKKGLVVKCKDLCIVAAKVQKKVMAEMLEPEPEEETPEKEPPKDKDKDKTPKKDS